ncbi:hypothetical protein T03_4322, partial [Trichinella britovi]
LTVNGMQIEELKWMQSFDAVPLWLMMKTDEDSVEACPCIPEPPAFGLNAPPVPFDLIDDLNSNSESSFVCDLWKTPSDLQASAGGDDSVNSEAQRPFEPVFFIAAACIVGSLVLICALTFLSAIYKRNKAFRGPVIHNSDRCVDNDNSNNNKSSPVTSSLPESSTRSDWSYYSIRPILKRSTQNSSEQKRGKNGMKPANAADLWFEPSDVDSIAQGYSSAVYDEIGSNYYKADGINTYDKRNPVSIHPPYPSNSGDVSPCYYGSHLIPPVPPPLLTANYPNKSYIACLPIHGNYGFKQPSPAGHLVHSGRSPRIIHDAAPATISEGPWL